MGISSIWAVEPLGATRVISAGTSTLRPLESVTVFVSTPASGS